MSSNNVAVVNDNNSLASEDLFSDARIEMIRNQIAKGAPNDVFAAMLDIAKRRGLDPLAKQINLIHIGKSWQIITTIDGYRAIAEQTGQYAGSSAPEFTFTGRKTLSGKAIPDTTTVTVHKLINGHAYPFAATIYFDEYTTHKNLWDSKPCTMAAKVAESHALRKAFPAVMSGMYAEGEMDQAIEGTARVVQRDDEHKASAHSDHETGEIHETKPANIQQQAKEQHELAMRRVHAVLKKHGLDHHDLHRHARAIKLDTSTEFTTNALHEIANALEDERRQGPALAFYARLREAHEEQSTPQESTPEEQDQWKEINEAVGREFDAQQAQGGQ